MDQNIEGAPPSGVPAPRLIDWDAVRADYEGFRGTIAEICVRYGISKSALEYRQHGGNWVSRRPKTSVGRSTLIARMFKVLERQVAQLENEKMTGSDKEVTVLGNLTRTLDKLIEIDTARRPQAANTPQAKDMAELRTKLAERIDQLKQR